MHKLAINRKTHYVMCIPINFKFIHLTNNIVFESLDIFKAKKIFNLKKDSFI